MSDRVRMGLIAAVAVLLLGGAIAVAQRSESDNRAGGSIGAASGGGVGESSTTSITITTTAPPSPFKAVLADGVARAVTTPNGVVLAVLSTMEGGKFLARSPCGNDVTVTGAPLSGATVVLDPGHGGGEPGAVGPAGTLEKDVNLAIALETKRQLEAEGATVVLTRTGDYRITLKSRTAIARALQPELFLSIHHNAAADAHQATPGAETFYQIASADSKRAAGLIYEEVLKAFSAYPVDWVAESDAGAKYRPRDDGTDYYGVLHGSAGVSAVLSEAAFISNPPEEALLADPAFQAVEAGAFTRAVIRYVTTDDPGSGFVVPYPRTSPAGGGGGPKGCIDPPFAWPRSD